MSGIISRTCPECGDRFTTNRIDRHYCSDDCADGHSSTYVDSDGEERCECGKWLEPGYYELEDHQRTVSDDGHERRLEDMAHATNDHIIVHRAGELNRRTSTQQ